MSPRAATRYLVGAIGLPVVVAVGGALVLLGPWSPLAIDRANSRYTTGDVAGARAAYEEVAEGWHFPDTRAEAAMRAGLLAQAAGDNRAAADWLRRAADLHPDAARRGEIEEQLAAVYRDSFADPVRAAEELERAAVDGGGARPLVAAAECWERADRPERALDAWTRAAAATDDPVALATIDAGLLRTERAAGGVAEATP
jgi:tetratricopeptide (TPR) repeat protein